MKRRILKVLRVLPASENYLARGRLDRSVDWVMAEVVIGVKLCVFLARNELVVSLSSVVFVPRIKLMNHVVENFVCVCIILLASYPANIVNLVLETSILFSVV